MQMPETYTEIVREVARNASNNIANAERIIHQSNEQRDKNMQALNDATLAYLRTGIADLRGNLGRVSVDVHGIGWGNRGFVWAQYFRRLAKEMGRPFVRVSPGAIHMPNRRYMDPFMAMFRLMEDSQHVRLGHDTVDQWVTMYTPEANGLVGEWMHMCTTDPDMRRVLGTL